MTDPAGHDQKPNGAPEDPVEDLPQSLPVALTEALGQLVDHQVEVPDEINQRIVVVAKEHLSEQKAGSSVLRRIGPWLAAAAACIVLMMWLGKPGPLPTGGGGDLVVDGHTDSNGRFVIKNDVDGSGQVDILDAFAVARDFQIRFAANQYRDLNGDGAFDQSEVRFAFTEARAPNKKTKRTEDKKDASRKTAPVRFTQVKIYIDSGKAALAAYQLELSIEAGDVEFVGIGNGEHQAFSEPAYYDPRTLKSGRLDLSAFHTLKILPAGRTLVAQVQVMVRGDVKPSYQIKLQHAADNKGRNLKAVASIEEGK